MLFSELETSILSEIYTFWIRSWTNFIPFSDQGKRAEYLPVDDMEVSSTPLCGSRMLLEGVVRVEGACMFVEGSRTKVPIKSKDR